MMYIVIVSVIPRNEVTWESPRCLHTMYVDSMRRQCEIATSGIALLAMTLMVYVDNMRCHYIRHSEERSDVGISSLSTHYVR